MAIDHAGKVRLLAALCRELARFRVHAVLSDARPALWLRADRVTPRLWVSVSTCGEFFEWWLQDDTPLVAADLRGAAGRIAKEVRRRPGASGPPPPPGVPAKRVPRCST